MLKLKLLTGAMALAAAAPAAAQYYPNYNYQYGDVRSRIEQLGQRLERGIQDRRLTRQEAFSLRQELRSLRDLERRYASNGINAYERGELNRRIANLRERLRIALRNDEYRGRDYDRDGRGGYGRDGQWEYDRDRDDDRDWDDDRDDDRWDRRGEWDERGRWNDCPPGLERRNNGCVPPGQERRWDDDDHDRSGGWYAVPERYRYQYRDTDRYYYRYRDGYIYQMDRRTNRTVNTIYVGR
jgi:hypothetical protein